MLYTSVPLERIYHNFRENKDTGINNAKEQAMGETSDYKEVMLKHGRIVTKRDGENYVIQKVYSTDMGDYLNAKYSPGQAYQKGKE